MGRNVFVSYKFADDSVAPLPGRYYSTARDYVNTLETILNVNGHAYFGERDNEDLSYLSEDQIYEKLKNKIFPTSCTIVLISPNMRVSGKRDRDQWIPWEVYFSLRETTRADYTSRRNAILAVVLPDRNGNYSYALEHRYCCPGTCTHHYTDRLFTILRKNMFNKKNGDKKECGIHETIWYGEYSYIPMVRWDDFLKDVNGNIERVESIKNRSYEFDLHISVDE